MIVKDRQQSISLNEAKENMRVEFRIVRVDAETIAPDDFNF